jgi:hypothetical protein
MPPTSPVPFGPIDNPESWQQIHEFIDEFPDDAYWSKWKFMVREVVSSLEALGLAKHFRIGQSMHDIMISTADYHGLSANEPRVILVFQPREDLVRIAYSDANLIFKEPLTDEHVAITVATDRTLEYLRRLWNETKSSARMPNGLSHP